MKRWLLWVPLIVFVGLLGLVWSWLVSPGDRVVRSALVGTKIPAFELAPALADKPGLATPDLMAGEPRLLNIFASWCVPCAAEAPQLMRLQAMGVPIDAVAIRDRTPDIRRFLDRYGDPYARIGADPTSGVQLALGSSGVPETFVVAGDGTIVAQHVGPITEDDLPMLLGALRRAQ